MFSDVYFTPILINHLADVIFELSDDGASGIFNVVGRERLSKYDFGLRVAKTFGYQENQIYPISVKELNLQADRPKDMSLSCVKVEKQIGRRMPTVIDGLNHLLYLDHDGWRNRLGTLIPTLSAEQQGD